MAGGPEILGSGSEPDWDREPLGALVLGRLRRRPRLFLALAVVCALVAALGVVAVGWYGVRYLTGPELPDLTSARAIGGGDDEPDRGWQGGPDGRPSSPATVAVRAELTFGPLPADGLQILGLAGPGVIGESVPLPVRSAGVPIPVKVAATLDCASTPVPVAAGSYGLRVRGRDGSRERTGTIPAGALAPVLADAVERSCGSWLARRDLTVVGLATTIDPTQPIVDVKVSVANRGPHPAELFVWDSMETDLGLSRLPLAPGATRVVAIRVQVAACGATGPQDPAEFAVQTVANRIPMMAATGRTPFTIDAETIWSGSQSGVTGLVMTPQARRQMADAVAASCGGTQYPITLMGPGGVRVDRATRTMTVDVRIDLTPGRVHDVTLPIDASMKDPSGFVPLWSPTQHLVPDRSGQVATVLRYRIPATCNQDRPGGWLDGFPPLAIEQHVVEGDRVRVIRYDDPMPSWAGPDTDRSPCD